MHPPRVVFSDIDGTIMHDPLEQKGEASLLITPPSVSGRQGAISARTILQVADLRRQGVKFVVISGARMSTILMRMPYLPAADALVCENGGRIFYPGGPLPTACPVTEDLEWRKLQAAAGPAQQDGVPAEQREGQLWDWYRKLADQGWTLDASGYTTSFRVHAKNGKSLEDLQRVIETAPAELSCTFNLGAADFYPRTSGKCEAARFLMSHFGVATKDCAFLCDDDNDMELAAVVGKAFLPSISSATKSGTDATEEMLDALADWCGLEKLTADVPSKQTAHEAVKAAV